MREKSRTRCTRGENQSRPRKLPLLVCQAIAATNFRSLRIVLRFDRATDQIGVRASFCGADGLRQFATLRTQRARIETRLGASVGEQEARRGRTPGFSIERSNASLSTAQGEASVLKWIAIEGRNGCQLSIPLARGYEAPIEQWSEIHEQLIDTMIELHATLQPYIDRGEVERV